ncbi:Putative protein of unknown function [Podospora comata]|uniref:Uncharacterized protein n=1 Tax=Podospora comata TaxID=48703 RepID=A0ABY6RUL0_PODCO|nr:Putative protein of unknown function [Podospora comata]
MASIRLGRGGDERMALL